jgi:hypothetical protein
MHLLNADRRVASAREGFNLLPDRADILKKVIARSAGAPPSPRREAQDRNRKLSCSGSALRLKCRPGQSSVQHERMTNGLETAQIANVARWLRLEWQTSADERPATDSCLRKAGLHPGSPPAAAPEVETRPQRRSPRNGCRKLSRNMSAHCGRRADKGKNAQQLSFVPSLLCRTPEGCCGPAPKPETSSAAKDLLEKRKERSTRQRKACRTMCGIVLWWLCSDTAIRVFRVIDRTYQQYGFNVAVSIKLPAAATARKSG